MSIENINNNPPRYGVVLITASSEAEGESIARTLIEAKLAACVSLTPVRSIYTWQEKINFDREWQLIIKTDLNLFSALESKVKEIHSYEVPEIIALPIIAGSQSYLDWIATNVKK